MSTLNAIHERLRQLFRRRTLERELDEEMEFHIEQEAIRQVAAGADVRAARRAARVAFGSSDRFREEARDRWTGALFFGLAQDVQLGVRRLAKRPAFTAVALCTLALGIGANTAVFSLVRGVLLEPFPYRAAHELVVLWNPSGRTTDDTWLSVREVLGYRESARTFTEIAAYTVVSANLTDELEPERVKAGAMTVNMFATLGVLPHRGRTFRDAEGEAGNDQVVILGHNLWQRRFGGADVIGTVIRVNGEPHEVVGIMPAGFQLPLDYRDERQTELWIPFPIGPDTNMSWGNRSFFTVARLAPGATAAQATDDIQRVQRMWEDEGHVNNADGRLDRAAFPLDALLLRGVRPALLILFGAVGCILLIACANVMHLLLARSDTRRREIATQAAVGATRARIARQLLVESGLLALAGAMLGVVLAWLAVRTASTTVPVNVIRARDIALDLPVLGFTALLAFVTTLLAGMAPALQLSRVNVAHAMMSSRGDVAPLRRRVRRALVVLETALSLVLVIGAALLARSFVELQRVDLGYDTSNVLTLRLALPATTYETDEQVTRFYASVVGEVERLPGVASAAAVRILPLTETIGNWGITLEARPRTPEENPHGDWQIATPGYLETMRIPLVAGRYPTHADNQDGPPVAVVNETMAARYWPGESAVGKRFHLGTADQPWIEIVGVIPDIRHNAVLEEPREEMVLMQSQFVAARDGGNPLRGLTLVVRTAGDPLAVLPAVRTVVQRHDPLLPIDDVRTLDDVADAALAQPRFTAALLTAFAALALLLAAIGLYGVISFIATRRTNEMGIHLALGAHPAGIVRMVLGEGVALTGAGVVLGVVAAALLTRLIETQLFGVTPLDPATFVLVPALLLAIGALAAYLPARRAARVSPLRALATE
jgi:putative ABC transport system permease protein